MSVFNRPTSLGATASALTPLVVVILYNGVIFSTGLMAGDDAYDQVALAPPGWVIGLVWCVIFTLWGLARWRAALAGDTGLPTRRWIYALMGWGLLYPLLTGPTGIWISIIANAIALVLIIAALLASFEKVRSAFVLILPSAAWTCFANALGFMALNTA